jgi:hypothetical protein
MSLNGFAHCWYAAPAAKINLSIAAFAASFDSSQNRCVVAANVIRHVRRQEGSRLLTSSTAGSTVPSPQPLTAGGA